MDPRRSVCDGESIERVLALRASPLPATLAKPRCCREREDCRKSERTEKPRRYAFSTFLFFMSPVTEVMIRYPRDVCEVLLVGSCFFGILRAVPKIGCGVKDGDIFG